jgi:hypothetical protein
LPSHTDLTGNDYLKAPVDEHFSMEKNAAERDAVHWSSTAEKGQASSPGFYISINGPSAEIGFLAAALLKAKNGRVKLLPAGEAGLERLTDVTLEDHGQKLHVTDYAITGLSYEPETVWLDDDQRFFGTPGKWFSILRDGWGGANARLYALDRAAEDARNARLARDLAQHPAHPLAVEHVRVFDSERAAMREDQTVVIDKERITMAGPSASVSVPQDAQRIDGKGQTLLPGLFDMHVHVQPLDGFLNIASGVTSVRDMATISMS